MVDRKVVRKEKYLADLRADEMVSMMDEEMAGQMVDSKAEQMVPEMVRLTVDLWEKNQAEMMA